MPNVQQPEMRRSGETRLVQDSDGPQPGGTGGARQEHRNVPPDQQSPYGPDQGRTGESGEPEGRAAEGD
ncbi:hypothetical protein [Actinoplanes auranticolor]|uniref:Uncharacterized protein n=1 Tax=Actinoplanes auranticolor TaxID=47988 RepID=A0A919SIA0_9ACTN|nr:hypothetical protein [Actinoplanes auranticolor]GIM72017.1 hypothetical protein Aau02nite_48860 [Actinoplanes auranticolor]